jgi:hypothetical protein
MSLTSARGWLVVNQGEPHTDVASGFLELPERRIAHALHVLD